MQESMRMGRLGGGGGGGVTAGVRECDGCGWVRCAKGVRGDYVSWL